METGCAAAPEPLHWPRSNPRTPPLAPQQHLNPLLFVQAHSKLIFSPSQMKTPYKRPFCKFRQNRISGARLRGEWGGAFFPLVTATVTGFSSQTPSKLLAPITLAQTGNNETNAAADGTHGDVLLGKMGPTAAPRGRGTLITSARVKCISG